MSYGATYATLAQLKAYLKIKPDKIESDVELTMALESASAEIEDHCNRQFNQVTTATPRKYIPTATRLVIVDDFWDTASLIIQSGPVSTGVFGTPWAANMYELGPNNGIVSGVPGWPYRQIILPYTLWLWPIDRVLVTAKWGWAAVPKPVRQACLIIAATNYRQGVAQFGGAGLNAGGQGDGVVQIRDIPEARKKLIPYVAEGPLVG